MPNQSSGSLPFPDGVKFARIADAGNFKNSETLIYAAIVEEKLFSENLVSIQLIKIEHQSGKVTLTPFWKDGLRSPVKNCRIEILQENIGINKFNVIVLARNVYQFFRKKSKFLVENPYYWSKINIFGRKSLLEDRYFGQNLVENRYFGRKSIFWSKINILVENRYYGRKSIFWSKIDILVENRYFCRKS